MSKDFEVKCPECDAEFILTVIETSKSTDDIEMCPFCGCDLFECESFDDDEDDDVDFDDRED